MLSSPLGVLTRAGEKSGFPLLGGSPGCGTEILIFSENLNTSVEGAARVRFPLNDTESARSPVAVGR